RNRSTRRHMRDAPTMRRPQSRRLRRRALKSSLTIVDVQWPRHESSAIVFPASEIRGRDRTPRDVTASRPRVADCTCIAAVGAAGQAPSIPGSSTMYKLVAGMVVAWALVGGQAWAATITGQVLGAGAPIANSTVTLWAAGAAKPRQLGQARTGGDGRFSLNAPASANASLYVVAKGGNNNPAIAFMAVLGPTPPRKVVVDEFTTIASVWTHNQFLDGMAIKGHALGLKIAAGNVPNLVNLETGSWGTAILDSNNSTQTP